MTAWGWESTIEQFDVLFPTPRTRVLEMTESLSNTRRYSTNCLRMWTPLRVKHRNNFLDLQCLFHRWRCHRTAGLCQLWFARGLQGVGPHRRFGQGARLSSPNTASRGAASNPKSRLSTARWVASFSPTQRMTAIPVDDVFPNGPMRNTNGVQRGSAMDFPSTESRRPVDARLWRCSRSQAPFIKAAHSDPPKFPSFPFPAATRCRCSLNSKGRLAPDGGWRGALCRSLTTLAPAR